MTELFTDDDKTPVVVKNEDGSIKIGDTMYGDADAAFKGKLEADKHITLIQEENKVLRDEVESQKKNNNSAMEKLFSRLDEVDKSKPKDDLYGFDDDVGEPKQRSEGMPDIETISKLVDSKVEERLSATDQARQQQQRVDTIKENAIKVKNALIAKFGTADEAKLAWDAYKESSHYNQAVHDLQMEKTPDAVIDAIGRKSEVNFNKANLPSGGYSPNAPTGQVNKGWSYWRKLMKENPREYRKPELAIQRKADIQHFGKEAFFAK